MRRLAWDSEKAGVPKQRERSADLYHTSRWTKLARSWKMAHPLCEECRRKGIVKAAECVDHIIPYPICEDFFDRSNLQSLCSECNTLKGIYDRPMITKWKREHPDYKG